MIEIPTLDALAEMTEPEMRALKKDAREAAKKMGAREARYLVDMYYTMQKNRIRSGNQLRALEEAKEPPVLVNLLARKSELLESEIRSNLNAYAQAQPLGVWALSIKGIGPVLAAGLLSHVDFKIAKTAGAIWRFAGLDDPKNYSWKKGEKRPWNARLKVLCWKIGQSFMKLHNDPDCFYGKLYEQRKAFEVARNEAGGNADAAKLALDTKTWRADTTTRAAYEAGRLPDGRIELRAERYAVKIFLSHFFAVGYEIKHGKKAPIPYAIGYLGHVHEIAIPNWLGEY